MLWDKGCLAEEVGKVPTDEAKRQGASEKVALKHQSGKSRRDLTDGSSHLRFLSRVCHDPVFLKEDHWQKFSRQAIVEGPRNYLKLTFKCLHCSATRI